MSGSDCYEVSINGEVKFTAGLEDPDQFEARIEKMPGDDLFILSVTATQSSDHLAPQYQSWGLSELGMGDEVLVRLIESESPDRPEAPVGELSSPYDDWEDEGELRCSFCSKCQREVEQLVCGEEASICDECIADCLEMVSKVP